MGLVRCNPNWINIVILYITITTFIAWPPTTAQMKGNLQLASIAFKEETFSPDTYSTTSIAWGDVDNDGDLDLAVGNVGVDIFFSIGEANRLYLNEAGKLQAAAAWVSTEAYDTNDLAWGDVDNDGDLDLAVGNGGFEVLGEIGFPVGQPNHLYLNENGMLLPTAIWTSTEKDNTSSVAWGDVNEDGYLDLAVGNDGTPDRIYLNQGGMLSNTASWSLAGDNNTSDVAWGDVNGDGHLDLAVGNGDIEYDFLTGEYQAVGKQNEIYLHNGISLELTPSWLSDDVDSTGSIAWGDVDNDGDLDLAVGNFEAPNRVYINNSTALETTASWSSTEVSLTASIALGDIDNDGDLDLVTGNRTYIGGAVDYLYLNDGGQLQQSASWTSPVESATSSLAFGDVDNDGDLDLLVGNARTDDGEQNLLYRNNWEWWTVSSAWSGQTGDSNAARSVAWGDMDKDGDLDLAVGYGFIDGAQLIPQHNHVYLNEGGQLQATPAWSSVEAGVTTDIAWGDVNGDGYLDLAVGNNGDQKRVYLNTAGMLNQTADWFSTESTDTFSVAWGDVDGDGDLDLAVGNQYQPNELYLNEGGVLELSPSWVSAESFATLSIAWGDVDNDGDLDLAAGNLDQPNVLYRNDGGTLTRQPVWSSQETDQTTSVAWGDIDGDGHLDLVVGNLINEATKLYRNNGQMLSTTATWSSMEQYPTRDIALGDTDGDGDLDLVVGNGDSVLVGASHSANQLYRNDNGHFTHSALWESEEKDITGSIALGDIDGDGDLDLAVGNQKHPSRIYYNPRRYDSPSINTPPYPRISTPTDTAPANFFFTPQLLTSTIPIDYVLFDAEGDLVERIFPEFSPNGGGQWFSATPGSGGDGLTDLAASPNGTSYTFVWNAEADLIRSDNVIFRISAQPSYTHSPIQWPAVDGKSPLFRTQAAPWFIRVVDEQGAPISGTVVYADSHPITKTITGLPVTDSAGLLSPGPLKLGTALVALVQKAQYPTSRDGHNGWAYQTYISNLTLSNQGEPQPTLVTQPGEQRLIVQSNNPLILFNIVVSIEWDATNEYLDVLADAFRKASDYLYDVSDGQMAFGQVTIYDNSEHWADADIQFSTKNTVHPYAFIGGIISGNEGHTIRLGRFWNGDSGNKGNWNQPAGYRTLIHEFGHYALYLHDEYFIRKFDANDNLIGEESAACKNHDKVGPPATPERDKPENASIMYYQYNASELSDKTFNWSEDCQATEQARLNNGESDWETVLRHYGEPSWKINTPSNRGSLMVGPTRFPTELLPFPKISIHNDGVTGGLIRKLTVRNPQGQPIPRALVALYTSLNGVSIAIDQGLTDLQGQIDIYGAASGDTIRVATFNGALAGTLSVTNADNYQLTLSPTSTSGLASQNTPPSPYLTLIPDTGGDRLTLEVHGAANGGNLLGAIIPGEGGGSPQSAPLVYSPTLGAYTSQVELAGVGLGSGSVRVSGVAGNQAIFINSNYNLQQVSAATLNHLYSEDGNFELHIPPGGIPANGYATVLPTGYVPGPLPDGKQVIGSAYQVRLSGSVVELDKEGSIRLHYHPQVMGVYTNTAIYYWNEAAEVWQAQGGTPGDIDNSLSVPATRLGIYALMGDQITGTNSVYLPVIKKTP